jgi:hypothetical protein
VQASSIAIESIDCSDKAYQTCICIQQFQENALNGQELYALNKIEESLIDERLEELVKGILWTSQYLAANTTQLCLSSQIIHFEGCGRSVDSKASEVMWGLEHDSPNFLPITTNHLLLSMAIGWML